MWRIKLGSQPSRPSPPFDPIVEAWLESLPLPTTKPSSKELKQWRLSNYHGLGWSVFVICIVLRTASLTIALPVTGVIASVIAGRRGPFNAIERLLPVVIVCPVVALWNTAELVFARVRRDGGISPNVHVVVDGVLFLGVATAAGSLLVDVICGFTDFPATFDTAAEEISSACLLIVIMVIHSFLLFFFVCNYVEQTRQSRNTRSQGMPRYTSNHSPWPTVECAVSDTAPPVNSGTSKGAFDTTTLELMESGTRPAQESAEFAFSPEPWPSTTVPPASTSEAVTLAQAMSGLWGIEAESPHQEKGAA